MNPEFTKTMAADHSGSAMEAETMKKNAVSLKNQRVGGFIFCVIISIFFASCSAKIYTKPNATAYTMRHQTIAILPPEIKVEVTKNRSIENRQEQEKVEVTNAQNEMYSRLLKLIQKRKMYLEIQDIEKTNATLLKMGYFDKIDVKMTPEELAQALGVDAILQSNYVLSQQWWVGFGIAYAIFLFPYGTPLGIMMATNPTNGADANIRLYDGSTGSLLYSYNNKFAGINAKCVMLVDQATKKAGKKMPYRKRW